MSLLFEPHSKLGFKKMDMLRAQFLLETLEDLDEKLQSLDSKLHVLFGAPTELIPELIEKYQISFPLSHRILSPMSLRFLYLMIWDTPDSLNSMIGLSSDSKEAKAKDSNK